MHIMIAAPYDNDSALKRYYKALIIGCTEAKNNL